MDIDKIFTDKVREYLNNGWCIHSATMGGSQGETAKIDLSMGKRIIRIYISKKFDPLLEYVNDKYVLTVGECTETIDCMNIIWNSKLRVIEEKSWYVIGGNKVTDDIEEMKKIDEVRRGRYQYKDYNNDGRIELGSKTFSILHKMIVKLPKMKSVRRSDIYSAYKINYSGWRYFVRLKNGKLIKVVG